MTMLGKMLGTSPHREPLKVTPLAPPASLQPAWAGVGRPITRATTTADAIRQAGLDWAVQQWPLSATDPATWKTLHVGDHVANVRADTRQVLGIVSKSYHVYQNAQAFDFLDGILGGNLATLETAGCLKGGRRMWLLAAIPREFRVAGDDVVKPYLLLVNSHDGAGSLRMIPTTLRIICANMFNLAFNQAGAEGLAIRHFPSLEGRVAEARRKLGLVAERLDHFGDELQALKSRQVNAAQLQVYFDGLLPPADSDRERQHREELLTALEANFVNSRNGIPGIRGSAWAAFNAVSEWADHGRHYRGKDHAARAEPRLDSVWFGSANDLKQKAYRLALELAGMN